MRGEVRGERYEGRGMMGEVRGERYDGERVQVAG